MREVKPFMKCVDYWPDGIPARKMEIYQEFIRAGQITNPHVIVNEKTRATTVEYYATIPHEWIRQEMAARL